MRHEYMQIVSRFNGKSEASSALVSNLLDSNLYSSASILIGFMPMECEPNILPLLTHWIESGRTLLLPSFVQSTGNYGLAEVRGFGEQYLIKGKYGILEPCEKIPRQLPPYTFPKPAIWLVPGIAFARNGLRLGRGGGYYDRLLAASTGVKIGVCFSCQLAESIPSTRQDVVMDYTLTESCITKCTSN